MSEYVRHVKRFDKLPLSSLGKLDIELTERCNNNCIHCSINLPENDIDAKSKEMSSAQVKKILEEAASLGCMQVRFTGGEPLLREDFTELYTFARRLGLKVLIFTNARLIDKQMAELFKRIPPLEPIEVTVYGMRKESYEAVTRAPGSYEEFMNGVNLLSENNIPFVVKSALLPPNKNEIDEFERWAEKIPWMEKKPSYSMFFDLRNRRDDLKKNELIKSLRVSTEEGLAMLTRDRERYIKTMQEFAEKFMGAPGDKLFGCGAGRGLCIDAYGFAQPCMPLRMPSLKRNVNENNDNCSSLKGGVKAHRLNEALNSYQKGDSCNLPLGKLRATNPEYLKRCAVCFLKGFCEQCPGKSWIEHGTLDTPVEYLCEIAHAQARWLGWLKDGEKAWEIIDGQERLDYF